MQLVLSPFSLRGGAFNIRIMNKINTFFALLLILLGFGAKAQFTQDHPKVEYMLKAEVGYLPYCTNYGHAGDYGYYIENMQHMVNVNVVNGVNISQDFFLGLGLGASYVAKPSDFANGWNAAMAFVDFDYRPLNDEWSPMAYTKLGAHYMMADSPYGNTLTPYAELGVGVNWFYRHVYRNMERNYHSLYLSVGFAYCQQTTFFPIRIGWRF